jgi:microfibrillar-associated protein 1
LVSITCNTPKDTTVHTGFHHVIFATQAHRAVPLLQSYLSSLPAEAVQREAITAQIESLSAFRYTSTIVINHTDDSLIPDRPRNRRDLNLVTVDRGYAGEGSVVRRRSSFKGVPLTGLVSETHTMATQVLPVPTGYAAELPQVYQTTNPIIAPREGSVVSVAVLERAVLTLEAKRSLQGLHQETGRRWWQCRVESSAKLGRLQGAGRMDVRSVPGVWICGSFAYGGIPLLEGCVVSARTVVEQGLLASEGVEVENSPW